MTCDVTVYVTLPATMGSSSFRKTSTARAVLGCAVPSRYLQADIGFQEGHFRPNWVLRYGYFNLFWVLLKRPQT
jgi:hypothetical protein